MAVVDADGLEDGDVEKIWISTRSVCERQRSDRKKKVLRYSIPSHSFVELNALTHRHGSSTSQLQWAMMRAHWRRCVRKVSLTQKPTRSEHVL